MARTPAFYTVHGPSLREERKGQGRSVQDVAAEARISRSYLQRLETGTRERMGAPSYIRLRTALKSTNRKLLAPPEDPPEER
ncbi:helix-turn-helix domain-containing protein [Streptomyces sp. NPDC002131]|uniref:helix-turn-helix domain-containing protein n=1 Tax=Streptomyces sp. NPDC002131 TaxID=3154535 RepID=UPI00332E4C47